MDWKRFNTLMNGLSNSEFGNCCILNRIRNIRNKDLSKIKDSKEKDEIRKAKERFALKKYKKKKEQTKEQEQSANEFNKLLGI